MNIGETKQLIAQFSLQPIRNLGQNFLVDEKIIRLTLEQAEPGPDDLVIEIGSGLGLLTRCLAVQAAKVITIEIDRYVLPALQQVLADYTNVQILHRDARKTDLARLASDWPGQIKVIANLPYYITTPLIEQVFRELPQAQTLIYMVQKEAADRITAAPGSRQYGPLAIMAALYGTVRKTAAVPRSSFYPQPQVDSALICLRHGGIIPEGQWPGLIDFLQHSFTRRRKTIINSWCEAGLQENQLNTLAARLHKWGTRTNMRPQEITPEQYRQLYSALQDQHI